MSRTFVLFLSCVVLLSVATSVTGRNFDCAWACYYNIANRFCDCPSPRIPLRYGKRGVRIPFRWGKRSSDANQPGSFGDSWYDSAPIDLSGYFQDEA